MSLRGAIATKQSHSGLTLIEVTITLLLFSILVGSAILILNSVLLSWSSSSTRSGIEIELERALDEMVRDLREATAIQSTTNTDEIRYTSGGSSYIYYLYHASDSYVPPPAFNQTSYQLKKAKLSGGIGGTFTYGAEDITQDNYLMLKNVVPPPTTDLSASGSLITIDLSVTRDDDTIRSRTQVRPRNL